MRLGWGSAERAFEAKQHIRGRARAWACGAVLAFCLLPLSAHAAEERPSFLGWEAGRLDYAYGASEVAAFVNTPEQVQLQIVLCALNEASPFRLSVLLPHASSHSSIIPVKLHVDGTVTHVYAEVRGNALEFQIDSAFLLTLPDSPTFELEFSPEDAAFLKIPPLLSLPMARAPLVLSEVARTCQILSREHGFECAPELISGMLWPRQGFNSRATLKRLAQQDPERAQQILSAEAKTSTSARITHINGQPVLTPIDLERACLRPLEPSDERLTQAPERLTQAAAHDPSASSQDITSQSAASSHSNVHATTRSPSGTRDFAPAQWMQRAAAAAAQPEAESNDVVTPRSFVLSEQCRLALDQVYARTGAEALSYLRELFYEPAGSYQRYATLWRTVMADAARMDFESPKEATERLERVGKTLPDYDYYLALYTLFSSGHEQLVQYPQSYYDLMHLGSDPATFLYAMDNRYELETVKYASVLVRRLTGFITPRRNVEEALTAWWSFYQELCALLPPLVRAQSLRPVLYRQMLMRLWRQAGYPQALHLRPEYAFVQGRHGRIVTGESLEAKCSIFEGSNNDQFFFSSPECHDIVTTDMRLLGYYNEDLRAVWRNWSAYVNAWRKSPFADNTQSDSAVGNVEANLDLTLLSLYKTYGFGDYYLLRKCISSRDSDICAYETFKNKESYQSDLRKSIASIAKVSRREARSLSELHRLWQRYYDSLCTFTNNLVERGMLSPWRAPFVQGVAVTAQAEVMGNSLYPAQSNDEF